MRRMPRYRLTSFDLCPYVQRSVITLEEKKVEYDIVYIDLVTKPNWFVKLSPLGKVPVLEVDGTTLFESAVINEYLAETTEGHEMLPSDPLEKARHRAWIEFGAALWGDGKGVVVAPDEETAHKKAKACRDKLLRLEAELGDTRFFASDKLSLVDAAIAPVLQRLMWCEEIAPQLDIMGSLPKVLKWLDALMAHPSVKSSTVPDIRDRFISYIGGKGTPTRNAPPSWLWHFRESKQAAEA